MSGSSVGVGDSVVGAGKEQREPEPWWVGKTGPTHTAGTSLYSMNDMGRGPGAEKSLSVSRASFNEWLLRRQEEKGG